MRKIALFMTMLMGAGQAFGQAPVPPNVVNYGPGTIDASVAYQYVGQTVTACGRAAQPDVNVADFVMGVSPYETIVVFPRGTNPQVGMQYNSQIVCVTGRVDPQNYMGIRAAIQVQDLSQIVTAEYRPPVRRSGPCQNPNGTISGRAGYGLGAAPRNGPLPPC
jgi:hypothetical protein